MKIKCCKKITIIRLIEPMFILTILILIPFWGFNIFLASFTIKKHFDKNYNKELIGTHRERQENK